jgi:hypothetical protein
MFFILVFPILMELYGISYIAIHYSSFGLYVLLGAIFLTVSHILTNVLYFFRLRYIFCVKCPNFSCTWNIVPKEIVDCYLQKNPAMMAAWIKSGYKII